MLPHYKKQDNKPCLSDCEHRIYHTLESSSEVGNNLLYGSPSTTNTSNVESFSSQFRNDYHKIVNETIILGPKSHHLSSKAQKLERMMSRNSLKEVLIACAKAISEDDLLTANCLISELRTMVSVSGEPIQRLGAYMLEGHLLYEVCPYFKFGYMSANGAIAEAFRDENRIHIVDFQIGQGDQWVSLIQAFAAQPGGPPQVRITGIDDPTSEFARGGGLEIIGKRLSNIAKACNLPFDFQAASLSTSDVELHNLVLYPGEVLAVNFPLMLHHIPDESVGPENQRDKLLRLVKSMSPKVVTLVEQESNTNTAPFFSRFLETLDYYSAIFESIDVTLARDHKDRIRVEQHCLAREIVNIIACEGADRVERHEVLGKWRSRFLMAGFRPYPLSPLVNATIRTLLYKYRKGYKLEEQNGALYLGWMNRALIASCAWQ